jgi:glycosyltransferase involved in cell wall biosynthesis
VTRDRITGWARDAAQPERKVRLRILDNDVAIGEVEADRHRADLEVIGLGDGRYGFDFAVPGGLSPQVSHVIRVQRVADGQELSDSPRLLAAVPLVLTAPTATQGTLDGHLDHATRERIAGWARDAAQPDAPVALEILDNGVPVTRVLANLVRNDLAEAGVGNGRHGFDIVIPGGLSPLVRHTIRVRREGDGADIPGSPAVIEAAGAFDDGVQQMVAKAVEAVGAEDDQERVLSFMLAQVERLRQARANADAGRAERLVSRKLNRRLGPQAMAATDDPQPRALVIDAHLPAAGRDAGSNAILSHIRALQQLGYAVSVAPADAMARPDPDAVTALREAGVACCAAPFYASVEDVLCGQAGCIDVVYLHRAGIASRYLGLARRHLPNARILFSVADLHHLRLERQAAVEQRPELLAASRRVRLEECVAAWQADAVLTHSAEEAALLRKLVPEANVHRVPWAVPTRAASVRFADRHGVVFVGSYAHEPNVDAACWLVEAVMPLVWLHDPDIACLLAGTGMPPAVRRLERLGAEVLGAVDDIGAVFDRVRLSAAPLRYGAGVKGKVLDSLASGVPCVMTPVAAEGIGLPPSLRALVAGDAAGLAALILRLHGDAEAHRKAARAGRALVAKCHNEAMVVAALEAAIGRRAAVAQPGLVAGVG